MALTKEQVFTAADQIAAAGQRPTLAAVRQITGGSFTTISPALNEWKAKQASAAVPLRDPAPQVVADRLAEVGAEIWAIALGLANARLAADRDAIEKTRADMEAAQAEAIELADRLTVQVEELQARLVASMEVEQAARADADQLRAELATAQEQAHTTEARAVEIERRAGELRTELDRAHHETGQAQAAGQAARTEADKLSTELATAREQVRSAEARAMEIERRAGELRTELDRAQEDAQRVRAAQAEQAKVVKTTVQERDQAEKAVSAAREDAAKLRGQVETLQAQFAELVRVLKPSTL